MKIKRYNYSKALSFFSILILLVLITGCNGGAPPIGELYGTIDVNSTPSGAKVYLDGEDTGQITPIVLTNIDVGDHIIELRKFHYQDWEGVVTVIAGQTAYLNPPLVWALEETIKIQPDSLEGKDTCVWYNHPTSNYGNDDYLWIGTYTGVIVRSYLQFDLSDVPPNAVILDANLGLYNYYSYGLTSIPIGLYTVTESWAEDTITWDNQPSSSSEVTDIQILPTIQTDNFVHWQIGDLVKGWREESIANYGMVLRHTDESSVDDIKWFFSSDYSTAINRPKLIINFYVP